jgi:hypothetical protein
MSQLRRVALLGYAHGGGSPDAQPVLRPGWAYAANLTPPELIVGHRLRRLRERLVLALCLAALAVALGFAHGFWRAHQADVSVQQANARTAALQAQRQRYLPVTQVQDALTQVRAELATLLTGDVDAATLLDRIRSIVPSGVSIETATLTLGGADGTAGSAAATAGDPAGTVLLQCSGTTIDDAPRFIDALASVPGVADVLPVSNTAAAGGTTFSLTFSLTDALLTHRYAAQPTAGSTAGATAGSVAQAAAQSTAGSS